MNDAKALIRRRYDEGAIIVASGSSVCLAAAAGIMDNKRAVVPLHLYAWFAESFPKVIVDCDENFSLDGRVLCGRVPTYQTSLTLNLLTELGAAELAKRVAKIAVPDVGMLHTMADIVDSGITVDLTDSIVHKASQWMRENLHQRVTLDDIAHATSTTRRTLLRHFERYAKITPHEHLMMLRIERAKLLLITSHQGMLEIANVCGYSDLRAFRRAFRAYAEVSPSDYRSSQRLRPEARRWRANELLRSTG